MEIINKKQVKMQGKYRASQSRCEWAHNDHKIVPWLTVNGLWLEKLGFKVGDKVNITGGDRRIVIELADEEGVL